MLAAPAKLAVPGQTVSRDRTTRFEPTLGPTAAPPDLAARLTEMSSPAPLPNLSIPRSEAIPNVGKIPRGYVPDLTPATVAAAHRRQPTLASDEDARP